MIWDRVNTLSVNTGKVREEWRALVAYLTKLEKEADYNSVSVTKTSDKGEEVILRYKGNEYSENEIIYKKNGVKIILFNFDIESFNEVTIGIETKNETDFVADFYFLYTIYRYVVERVAWIFSNEVCDMMKKYGEEERLIGEALFS